MRGIRAVACTVTLALATAAPAWAGYGAGTTLFTFRDPAIKESSGVASSAFSDDVIWTHNDSGDIARVFAVDRATGNTFATYRIDVGVAPIDAEDMARGPGADGRPTIFLADIGDNLSDRPSVTVYEIDEPIVDTSKTNLSVTVPLATSHTLVYEDGAHDAETFLVDPVTGTMLVVTKDDLVANETGPRHPLGTSGVYVAQPPAAPGAPGILHRVASIRFDLYGGPIPPGPFPANGILATGGDISPDGSRVAIRTYAEAFEWRIPNHDVAAAFATSASRIALPADRQGEALGYTRDGRGLMTTSEFPFTDAHLIRGDDRVTPDVTTLPLPNIGAVVTADGVPVAGRTVRFTTGDTDVCTAVTGDDGSATCTDPIAIASAVLALGYGADLDGDAGHQPVVAVSAL